MGNITNKEENSFPLTKRKIKKYGWVMDIPDTRDIYATIPDINNILPKVDLRNTGYLPEIFDQKDLGSCATHSVMTAYLYDLNKNNKKIDFDLSVSFVYYNQRIISNSVNFDSGSSIRDAMKVLNKIGVCSNELYPYDTLFFTDKPGPESYKQALENINEMLYKRVNPEINNILKILSYEIPVIFGFTVYESFENPDTVRTGLISIPSHNESVIGSKTAVIVGYDLSKKYFICCNSNGKKWGALGYFWIPFSFINERYCSDFWIFYSKKTKVNITVPLVVRQKTRAESPPKIESNVEQHISEEIKDVYKSPVFKNENKQQQQQIATNMENILLDKEVIEDMSEYDDKSEYGYISDED